MNKIEKEKKLLLALAAAGRLPGYPGTNDTGGSSKKSANHDVISAIASSMDSSIDSSIDESKYTVTDQLSSFYAESFSPNKPELSAYFSGENDTLETHLKALWANDPELTPCIPIILAAVEKSRNQEGHALIHSELYNYTM